MKQTIDHKIKISESLKKYYLNHPKARKKHSERMANRIVSKNTRRKSSISHKEYYKNHPEAIEKIRDEQSGEKNPNFGKPSPNRGNTYIHTKRVKKHLSKVKKEYYRTHPKEKLDGIIRMHKANKFNNTVPEQKVVKYIKFLTNELVFVQVPFISYIIDIVIPHLNLAIEVNGCYHHGCLECFPNDKYITLEKALKKRYDDKIRNEIIEKAGLKVIVIWEHDIKSGYYKTILSNLLRCK